MKKRNERERRETLPDWDDGRTVASMDMLAPHAPYEPQKRPVLPAGAEAEPMSRRDTWRYALSAVGAGLSVVAVFGVVFALFIIFCQRVWFR